MNERGRVSLDSFDIFEPPGAVNLLGQDAVKLRIDAVAVDRGRDELARRDLDPAPRRETKPLRTTGPSAPSEMGHING
jgi:hypothetical protein